MQYAVNSDDSIEIIHLSGNVDDADSQYVQVDAFPQMFYSIGDRIGPQDSVDWFTLTIGGTETLDHTSDNCNNQACPLYHKNESAALLASVPPIPIPGHDEIWWDFDGAYILFYFWLCRGCSTVITSNRCT